MQYRSEIDGLRSFAIIPVLLFHAGFPYLPGGFFGVDIFFVISGYLIASIIRHETEAGRFSILQFWERRARRILPALFLVCATTMALGWKFMLPRDYMDLADSLIPVSLFISNIYFWQNTADYFSQAIDKMPLIHSWSLSVEEQFYIAVPLFAVLFKRLRQSAIIISLLFFSAISFLLTQLPLSGDPNAAFYLTPTRAWELGIGCIIAYSAEHIRIRFEATTKNLLAICGLLLILASFLIFQSWMQHPGWITLMPVFGTTLLIVFANSENRIGRFLSLKPFIAIGLISYSLYLWHQPLLAFIHIHSLEHHLHVVITTISISFILAYLSWRVVEKPFRNKNLIKRSHIFAASGIGIIVMISTAYNISDQNGRLDRLDSETQIIIKAGSKNGNHWLQCHGSPKRVVMPNYACKFNPQFAATVALWGDSHASSLSESLGKKANAKSRKVVEYSYSACPPFDITIEMIFNSECDEFKQAVIDKLLQHPEIENVILLARWPQTIERKAFDNMEGGIEPAFPRPIHIISAEGEIIQSEKDRTKVLTESLQRVVNTLLEHGKTVTIIYPIPEMGWHILDKLAYQSLRGSEPPEHISISYEVFKARTASSYALLDNISDHPRLNRIYPEDVFCNQQLPGRCVASSGRQSYYFDDDHLNNAGADLLALHIVEHLEFSPLEQLDNRANALDLMDTSTFNE